MTALTKNISKAYRDGDVVHYPVAANANIKQGSLLGIDSAGRVSPATKASNKKHVGVALAPADNTGGAAGAISVTARRCGAFLFEKSGPVVVGKDAYVLDDNTVTDVSSGASKCGTLIAVEGDRVWVELKT